ncbi:MAG: bifunctional demethylmenaquinone methyltransferase/2-methoxy-6-polyprenyl-1,4-benzoquinol methylase UbiE [Candidatus Saccharimonadales bacterium]
MTQIVKPYNTAGKTKKQEVTSMFNAIAPTYDFLNHFMSAGIDFWWRKQAVKQIARYPHQIILDVATGTGDLAIAAASLQPKRIVGLDIAADMVAIGNEKIAKKRMQDIIELRVGDSEAMPFDDAEFDVTAVGFGVRNFGDLQKGLSEMYRVTKKGGGIVVLEFSKAKVFPIKQLFGFYSRFIIPNIGRLISKDKNAYSYLPASVAAFPEGDEFVTILKQVGYTHAGYRRLMGGIASIYYGQK